MKAIRFVQLMAIGVTLTWVGSGCKHAPQKVTHIPSRAPESGRDVGGGQPLADPNSGAGGVNAGNVGGNPLPGGNNPTGIAANPATSHEGWKRDETALAAHTIHFAYDSSVIRSGEQANVSATADYLKGNPSAALEVDGNCDERGTDEYNRSLGERRALAVREALVGQGIEPGRVDTRSYGRDRPIDLGHTEAAWAKNRRGELILLTPP